MSIFKHNYAKNKIIILFANRFLIIIDLYIVLVNYNTNNFLTWHIVSVYVTISLLVFIGDLVTCIRVIEFKVYILNEFRVLIYIFILIKKTKSFVPSHINI